MAVVWQTRLANLFLSKSGDENKKLKHVEMQINEWDIKFHLHLSYHIFKMLYGWMDVDFVSKLFLVKW